ncbi:hypothetical protein C4D60_Mb05t02630 [Musa balbisiana]|uniref:Uncharacterized protein n=1 Tax=Musa balbisiana TaxID=52838 RepID=A0A4S8JT71_MUSBA|nr:hypothetical protein C4D60_Mb05t02630 [Musa balbisiana]
MRWRLRHPHRPPRTGSAWSRRARPRPWRQRSRDDAAADLVPDGAASLLPPGRPPAGAGSDAGVPRSAHAGRPKPTHNRVGAVCYRVRGSTSAALWDAAADDEGSLCRLCGLGCLLRCRQGQGFRRHQVDQSDAWNAVSASTKSTAGLEPAVVGYI